MKRIFCRHPRVITRLYKYGIYHRKFSATATVAANKTRINEPNVKPFSDIPEVKGLPLIGTIPEWLRNVKTIPQFLNRRVDEYGPIFREKMGLEQQVFTANIDDWENVLRGESRGKAAERHDLWSIDAHRKSRGLPKPFVNARGDEYQRMKEGVKHMLKPSFLKTLVPMISDATDDLTELLSANIKKDGSGIIEDMQKFIQRWTFECGGIIIHRTRFGLLKNDSNQDALKMMDAAATFFRKLYILETGLPHHRSLLTSTWREYADALDTFIEFSKQKVDTYGEYITDKNTEMDEISRYLLVADVLVAASDTVAHTALWIMIELSNNPEVQEKLYDEIIKKYPDDGQLTTAHLNMPYLRGFLKEVFRVRPLITMFPQRLSEDLIISGYYVPAGCTVNLLLGAYDKDDWFTDANMVKPERWQRERKTSDDSSPTNHPFAVLPFGHGHRSCLGRRIAESDLYVFVTKMVRRFKISPVKEYDVTSGIFLAPVGEINFKFEERT